MTTVISGSSPSITFSDSTTQSSGVNTTNPVFTGDASISGLTVGKGGGAVATNTAVGASALTTNSSGANNTAVGYQAGYSASTTNYNTFIGRQAGYAFTGSTNDQCVFVGNGAGSGQITGINNTYVGPSAGYLVTTGGKNTILGGYNGNQGGLDIRTSSNNIVLSDGDGNPRQYTDGTNSVTYGARALKNLTSGVAADLIPYSYIFPTNSTLTSAIVHLAVCGGNGVDGASAGYYTLSLVKAFSTYTVTVINSGLPQNEAGYGFTFSLNSSYLRVTPAKTCSFFYVASILTGAYTS